MVLGAALSQQATEFPHRQAAPLEAAKVEFEGELE
jgi:hypothetical protein